MSAVVAVVALVASPARGTVANGTIAGHVTSAATGASLPYVGYEVYGPTGAFVTRSSAGSDGMYSVSLPPGRWIICINAAAATRANGDGYPNRCTGQVPWDGFSSPRDAMTVNVSSGVTTTADIALPPAARIRGKILDASDGTPVSDVGVYAHAVGGRNVGVAARSGADGTYDLTRVDPAVGSVAVCFDPGSAHASAPYGYARQCYDGAPWGGGSAFPSGLKPVPVSSGATTSRIDAHLDAAGAISGTIRDADGAPVRDAEVLVYRPNGHLVSGARGADRVGVEPNGDAITGVRSGDDGTYTFGSLGTGVYYVCVSAKYSRFLTPGHASQCWQSQPWTDYPTPLPDAAAPVRVTLGQAETGVDMRLVPDARILVSVLDAAGRQLRNPLAVRLYDSTGLLLTGPVGSEVRSGRVYFLDLTASTSGYAVCAENGSSLQPTCWPDVPWAGGNAPPPSDAGHIRTAIGQRRSIKITLSAN